MHQLVQELRNVDAATCQSMVVMLEAIKEMDAAREQISEAQAKLYRKIGEALANEFLCRGWAVVQNTVCAVLMEPQEIAQQIVSTLAPILECEVRIVTVQVDNGSTLNVLMVFKSELYGVDNEGFEADAAFVQQAFQAYMDTSLLSKTFRLLQTPQPKAEAAEQSPEHHPV